MKVNRKVNRKLVAVTGAIAAIAAGGVGIAQAVGGRDSEERVTGPSAEKAKSAALKAVGVGSVTEVERQENGRGFEVEVRRNDGSHVDVRVDHRFQSRGTESGDDDRSESGRDREGADGDR